MRVKAAIWVAAYIRRVNATGEAAAVLARKGAEEAGAILLRVEAPDGTGQLYVPAPQSVYDEERPAERLFVARFPAPVDASTLAGVIEREIRIDPDIWIVAVEDRALRHFLGEAMIERDAR